MGEHEKSLVESANLNEAMTIRSVNGLIHNQSIVNLQPIFKGEPLDYSLLHDDNSVKYEVESVAEVVKKKSPTKDLTGAEKKSKKKIPLTVEDAVKTLSIKGYVEQVPALKGEFDLQMAAARAVWAFDTEETEETKQDVINDCIDLVPFLEEYLRTKISGISVDYCQVVSIVHDTDNNKDDIWLPSREKPHFHIIVKVTKTNKKGVRMALKIRTILNMLGIVYRSEDANLWIEHGVETIQSFPAYVCYLTHETDKAIKDGKTQYPHDKLISNLTEEELEDYRQANEKGYQDYGRTDFETMRKLDLEAYAKGYALESWEEFYLDLPFAQRLKVKEISVIEKQFRLGIEERVRQMRAKEDICRTVIYVQSPPNIGKSHFTEKYFEPKTTHIINGGETGKFDKVQPVHKTLIFDDAIVKLKEAQFHPLYGDTVAEVYHRGKNNSYFCGDVIIILTNLNPEQYYDRCGVKIFTSWEGKEHTQSYKGIISRINYVVYDEYRQEFVVKFYTDRGLPEKINHKKEYVDKFVRDLNASVTEYREIREKSGLVDILKTTAEEPEKETNRHDILTGDKECREWCKIKGINIRDYVEADQYAYEIGSDENPIDIYMREHHLTVEDKPMLDRCVKILINGKHAQELEKGDL